MSNKLPNSVSNSVSRSKLSLWLLAGLGLLLLLAPSLRQRQEARPTMSPELEQELAAIVDEAAGRMEREGGIYYSWNEVRRRGGLGGTGPVDPTSGR